MLETFLTEIVANVQANYRMLTGKKSKNVYCHIGNSSNIVKELTTLKGFSKERFPIVAFMRPFKVKDMGGYYDVSIRRVAIATVTINNESELEKIRTNFDLELRPLNELFREALTYDKRVICGVNGVEYTTEDMPYFNSNIEPQTSEKMDGIVIDNLTLKINKVNCNLLNCN